MGTRARALAVGTAACAAIVIAGCGGGSQPSSSSAPAGSTTAEPSSAALIADMQASVRQATSVHVTGRLTNNGVPIGVNLDMHQNGDVSGTESLSGAPYQIIGVHGTVYVKATRAFLQEVKAPASACAFACGRWLQLTPVLASQLTGDFNMSNFTGPLTSSRLPRFTEDGAKTVSGHTAWVLRASQGVSLTVSSASEHLPIAATTGGSTSEVIIYSRWNSAPEPVAPPASEVLNLNHIK